MKNVRVFIRYEDGTYKIEKLPYKENRGEQGLVFFKLLEEVFEMDDEEEMPKLVGVTNTVKFYRDTLSELVFYKDDNGKDIEESRLMFFRRIKMPNSPVYDMLPICVNLLDSDLIYLKKNWTNSN